MTAQVIFFSTRYNPTFEESMRLYTLQERLTLAHAELAYSCRSFSPDEKYFSKLRYHNGFRARLKLLHGFKGNNEKIVENC